MQDKQLASLLSLVNAVCYQFNLPVSFSSLLMAQAASSVVDNATDLMIHTLCNKVHIIRQYEHQLSAAL